MRIARERYEQRTQENDFKESLQKLSAREREVLSCLIEGWTSKDTARILHISPKTVDVHRASIMRKMTVTSVGELQRLIGRLHGTAP